MQICLRRRHATALLASAVLLAAPAAAWADSSPAGVFKLSFTSRAPGTATGFKLHEVYLNPSDRAAKPSPVRRTVLQLPAGSVLDGRAIAACRASDTELMLTGPSGCPPDSRIGQGTVEVTSGFGPPFDPFVSDATLFNGGTQTIEMFAAHGTGLTLQIGHQQYSGPSTLTENVAPIPGGPPDGQSAPRQIDFTIDQLVGPSGQPFITTPRNCPANAQWVSTLTFTNADGHTYKLHSTIPCAAPRQRTKPSCPKHRSRAERPRRSARCHRGRHQRAPDWL